MRLGPHPYIKERAEALLVLRSECEDLGASNDWPDNLHLADVVEKHLCRPLREKLRLAGTYPRQ